MNKIFLIAVMSACLISAVQAGGFWHGSCNGKLNCNDDSISTEADADARANSDADVRNSGNSENDNDNRNSAGASATVAGDTITTVVGGDREYSDDDIIIEGDTDKSRYSYKYEEASNQAATLIASVCQDGTSLQGVQFGMSSVKQSLFCMYTTAAQLKFNAALMQDCGPRESIAKGGTPIPSPQPTECERSKRGLYLEGIGLVDKAVAVADDKSKKGWGRSLLGLIW